MWGATEGYVYLPTKDSAGEWQKLMYKWPLNKAGVIRHVLTASAEGKDVYFSPALFNKPKPVKENCKGANVLWADFDGSAPDDWTIGTPEGRTGAVVPLPSLRVQSSVEGHEHVYWHLDSFESNTTLIEEKNRALAYSLQADTSGWDINQVLRPPGTTNYKHNLPVFIAEERNDSYKIERFDFLKPAKQLVNENISIDAVPPVENVLAKYSWDTSTYELFQQPTLPDGKRSSALMQLGFFGAEHGMSDEEIFAILVHADDRWGKFAKRNDRQKRLTDIINRARHKYPKAISDLTFAGLTNEQTVSVDRKYIYGFNEFTESDFKVEWLISGTLQRAGLLLITAHGGVGKTQISYQMGCHAALGKSFIHWNPLGKSKVVMLSLEMGPAALKTFHTEIAKGYDQEEIEVLERNFKVAPLGEPILIDKPQGRKLLEFFLDEYNPDLVIIDSLGKLINGDIKDDSIMRTVFNYLSIVRAKYGCAFWVIHHNRKGTSDNKKPREIADVYGSQYITSEPDTVISLWKDHGEEDIEIRNVKNRLAPEHGDIKIRRIKYLNFELSSHADVPQAFEPEPDEQPKPLPKKRKNGLFEL
jgi:hypothetical protein